MADPQNNAYIGVGYTFDEQSANQTINGIDRVTRRIEYFGDVADSAAKTARSAVEFFELGGRTPVVEPFQALPPVVRTATQSLEELETKQTQVIRGLLDYARANETAEDAIRRLRKEEEKRGRVLDESPEGISEAIRQQTADTGKASNPFGRIGRTLYNLPSIPLGGISTDQIGRILRGVGQLNVSVAQLGTASLIAAPALVLLGIGIKNFTETVDKAKRALTGALAAQNNYYEALGRFTEAQVQTALTDLERGRVFLEQQIAETRNATEAAFSQAAQLPGGDPTARVLDALGMLPTAQLREQLADLEAQYQENIQTTERYRQGLAQGVFAQNEAAAAQRAYIQTMLDIEQLTTEQRLERIEALRREGEVLAGLLEGAITDPVIVSETLDRIQELSRQIELLSSVTHTAADAEAELAATRARQLDAYQRYIALELQLQEMDAAARKERIQAIQQEINLARLYLSESVGLDTGVVADVEGSIARLEQEMRRLQAASDTAADALNRTTRAQNVNPTIGGRGDALTTYYDRLRAFTEQVTDSADDLLEANKTLTDAQAELADAQRDLADLDSKYQADQLAAAADANADLEKIQQDHEAARSEIVAKGEIDRQRILRQSNASLTISYAQRDALAAYLAIQNRNQQLADQKDQETEALAQADAAANEQRAAAAVHYRDALNDLQRRYDQEKTIRDRAVQQARADVTNAEYNLKYIRDQYNNLRIASEYNTQNQVMSAVQQGGAAIVQQWGLIAAQSAQAINAAFHNLNMANQRQALAAGAVGATSARGNTVTINVAGAQLRTIDARSREQALRVMNGIFDQIGLRT